MSTSKFLEGGFLPVLFAFSEEKASISKEEILEVAKQFKLDFEEVRQVVDEVLEIPIRKTPQKIIKVCTNIHCNIAGSEKLVDFLCQKLKVKLGEISQKTDTALVSAKCFGYCDIGPNIEINGKMFDSVTTQSLVKILKENEKI
ncbi:NAD(P)H-dependent oxidoreductase subunit E [bacterium]|nr:NAD(P)H-dependent oxidoreductase subunit E [bacterium]